MSTPGGTQEVRIINYHGVIRVAMISDAPRAPQFRDWAEEVLFQVMVFGSYQERSGEPELEPVREAHWMVGLGQEQRFRLMEMRYHIGLKLVEDPHNGILLGLLRETLGEDGAILDALRDRAVRIHQRIREERRLARKPTILEHTKTGFFDTHPEIRIYARARFGDARATFTQIAKEIADEFGLERPLAVGTVSKEYKVWLAEMRERQGEPVVEFMGI